jgi:hypothetical protein
VCFYVRFHLFTIITPSAADAYRNAAFLERSFTYFKFFFHLTQVFIAAKTLHMSHPRLTDQLSTKDPAVPLPRLNFKIFQTTRNQKKNKLIKTTTEDRSIKKKFKRQKKK